MTFPVRLAICLQLLATANMGTAFNADSHHTTTRGALVLWATPETLSLLVKVSRMADEGESKQLSAAHFDNCAWDEGCAWIERHRSAAVEAARRYLDTRRESDRMEVFDQLGYVIHAAEDFYSHSNWIDSHPWGVIATLSGPPPPGFYSGYWAKSLPHPSSPGPTHDQMHKDSSDRKGFPEAKADAMLSVQAQMREFQAELRRRYPDRSQLIIESLGLRTHLERGLDATAIFPNGKAYFFKEARYWRYDLQADRVDRGYPKPIAGNWPGLEAFAGGAESLDAVFALPQGKAYFFKGDQYLRYDIAADRADAGYPRPVAGNWPGLESLGNRVDCALAWPGGKIYFYRGDRYVRYDVAADRVEAGYPRLLVGNWHGLEPFADTPQPRSFDGAFASPKGKAYFFKGDQYIRYDIAADEADPGYPLPIREQWRDL